MPSPSLPISTPYDDPHRVRGGRKMILHRSRTALVVSSFVAICLALTLWRSRSNIRTDRLLVEAIVQESDYHQALQHAGTGARVQAFLDKARSGKPFTVSVIGGSVSKGRGLRRWENGQFLPPIERRRHRGPPPGAPGTPNGIEGGRKKREDEEDDMIHGPPGAHGGPPGGGRQGPLGAESPDGKPLFGTRTLYSPENMHVQVFNFLNTTFPHRDNRFVNGAQGGVGSGYFGWCFKEHIPEDSDLVLVELGINDVVDIDGFETYEMLVRRVSELKSKPAIINIEVFTTLFPALLSSPSLHKDVVAFYDIPSISIRDVLLPRIIEHPNLETPKWFRTGPNVWAGDPKVKEFGGVAVDLMHISALGHAFTANLVIRYFLEQLRLSPRTKITPANLDLPSSTLSSDAHLLNATHPVCRSMNSPNLHHSVSSTHTHIVGGGVQGVVPADGSHGWTKFHFKEKKYLVAKRPGAHFIYHFHIAQSSSSFPGDAGDEETGASHREEDLNENFRQNLAKAAAHHGMGKRRQPKKGQYHGTVAIGYQRSKILGFGAVLCWVDDRKIAAKVIDGWWDIPQRNMGRVAEVARDLAPGAHTLHCELLDTTHDEDGRTEFRLFAVMHN